MKKTLVISLLSLLFFSQIGYYLFYLFQQHELKESIKHELLKTIPETSLEIIDADINKNDIEWEEEGREFYFHGQLYDVASIKVVNGKTLIYCLNDKKEMQLLKELANAVSSGNDQSNTNNHSQHTIKFHLTDYIILSDNTTPVSQIVRQKHFGYCVALVTNIIEVNTPPPDLIF